MAVADDVTKEESDSPVTRAELFEIIQGVKGDM